MDISGTLTTLRQQLRDDTDLSPALRSAIEMLLLIVSVLANRLGLNSSKPPSSDPHRLRKDKKPNGKKAGGNGHIGATLKRVESPDEIQVIHIDHCFISIPAKRGHLWRALPGRMPLHRRGVEIFYAPPSCNSSHLRVARCLIYSLTWKG